MRRERTALLAGTLLLTACGGETEATTEPLDQQPADQQGVGVADEEAMVAFAACLEEQGIEAGPGGGRGGFGGGFASPPPGGAPGQRPTGRPTERPTDFPTDRPTDRPTGLPQPSSEEMAARQACAEEAGIDMAPGGPGMGGRRGPTDVPS